MIEILSRRSRGHAKMKNEIAGAVKMSDPTIKVNSLQRQRQSNIEME